MKTSDVTTDAFLEAIREASARLRSPWATRWDVTAVLAGCPDDVGTARACEDYPQMPEKIVLSKARNLMRRGLITGCDCGCRGDFSIVGTADPS